MRVLVLTDEPTADDEVVAALRHAGHRVARCHDEHPTPSDPHAPCRLMTGQGCPLDDGVVDAAICVGRRATVSTVAGVRCATRDDLPVVWVPPGPIEPGATERAIEQALSAPLLRHTDVAQTTYADVLARRGIDPTRARASVRREGRSIGVRLGGIALDVRTRDLAALRVLASVRAVDRSGAPINVRVDDAHG